ncbi:CD20-like domain-containing protein [Dellaglioa sp. BT-FLS60]
MSEKKVLGLLSIIWGGLALVFSWVPIINNFAFFLGVIGVILGFIALIINRKSKKTLALIGTVLSIIAIAIVLMAQSSYSDSAENTDTNNDTASKSVAGHTTTDSEKDQSKTNSKEKSITVAYTDYKFNDSKNYAVNFTDNSWAGTKVKIDKVTVYKLVKSYSYESANDGTFNAAGFVQLHFSVTPSKDISFYPTQGTAIFSNGEQHEADSDENWDGDIANKVTKDGTVTIPVKSLKKVTSLTSIRFKFDADYDTDNYDDEDAYHTYDLTLNL